MTIVLFVLPYATSITAKVTPREEAFVSAALEHQRNKKPRPNLSKEMSTLNWFCSHDE